MIITKEERYQLHEPVLYADRRIRAVRLQLSTIGTGKHSDPASLFPRMGRATEVIHRCTPAAPLIYFAAKPIVLPLAREKCSTLPLEVCNVLRPDKHSPLCPTSSPDYCLSCSKFCAFTSTSLSICCQTKTGALRNSWKPCAPHCFARLLSGVNKACATLSSHFNN